MKMITKVAYQNMKYHKSGNILTGIAIFLATLLLLVVPTVGYDIIAAQRAMINECYPTWQAAYQNVGSEMVQRLSAHHDVAAYGLQSEAGIWSVEEVGGSLYYLDEKGMEMNHVTLIEGALPEQPDEIVVSQGILRVLGQEGAQVGDGIRLPCQIQRDGGLDFIQEQKFVISGLLEEAENQESFIALVSEEFLKQEIPEEQIVYYFLLQVVETNHTNTDRLEENIRSIAAQFDIPEEDILMNTEYLGANYVDPSFVPVIVLICLFIIFAGMITIYSIYYVSIGQRIQEFGRIKAIGATRRQIRQIMLREGMLTAACAIPIGLLFGSVLVKIILVKMLSMFENGEMTLEVISRIILNSEIPLFQWWIYLITILAVLITVYVSLIRPIRKAAKLSVMEAIRYQEKESGRHQRKGYEFLTIGRLTCRNIFRNRKKSLITIVSMSVTGVFLMVIATLLTCADPAESTSNAMIGQYRISQNVDYGNKEHPEREWVQIQKDNPLDESLLKQLSGLPGVERVDVFSEVDISGDIFEEGGYGEDICGIPEIYAEEVEKGIIKGKASYEDLKSGDGVIVDQFLLRLFPDLSVGDVLHINVHDGDVSYEKELTILAIGNYRFGLTNYNWLIMAKEAADSLSSYNVNRYFSVSANKDYDAALEQEIRERIAVSDLLELKTWKAEYEENRSGIMLTRTACYAFLGVLGAICIMNLINTMIHSVHVRKKELGMMQAIGMSDRQLLKMLQLEGAFYTMGTALVSIAGGSLAGYPIYIYAKKNGWFNIYQYHYPAAAAVVIALVLVLIEFLLVFALVRSLRKDTLIDRIRFSE